MSRPVTMAEVQAWLVDERASLHISQRGDKVLIVVHCAADHRSSHVQTKDLERGLKQLMGEFS